MSIINSRLRKQTFASSFIERLKDAFGDRQNKEIATLLGVSNPAVTSYLRGRVPPAEKLVEIAEFTGCNLHWLLTGEGPKSVIYDRAQISGRAKTILFHCSKGGVGTSTASLLTAVGLAKRGYKTLLIDNLIGSCTLNMFYNLFELSNETLQMSSSRKDINDQGEAMFFSTPVSGLDLVSFNKNHQSMLSRKKVRPLNLIPRNVTKNYSMIVVDSHSHTNPFGPTNLFMMSLLMEAKVFIPYEPYNADKWSIGTTLEYVKSAQPYSEGIEFLGLFLNNYYPDASMERSLRRRIKPLTNGNLLRSTIHKTHELGELVPKGLENFYQKKSKIVREYNALVTEFLERLGSEQQGRGRSGKVS